MSLLEAERNRPFAYQVSMTDDAFKTGQVRPRILLIEDDPGISQMLGEVLSENGLELVAATSSAAMDAELSKGGIDLIVLDIMLPGEDGLSICRRLRAQSMIPIIMLTALGQEADRVTGFEVGADDYVTKPFSSRELIGRMRALLRRSQGAYEPPQPASYLFAGWRLKASARELINPDGVRVTLTSAEFDLLLSFCQNPGQVLSREQLLELTHAGSAGPVARSIDVHVSRIRQKIEANAQDASYIQTVRLGGYIFTPTVEKQ